jgi:acylphosphatase
VSDLSSFQARVHGRVQGVYFRAFVLRRASDLGLTGYVRNTSERAVEVHAEGERKQLENLIVHLKAGPPAAKVDRVVVDWSEYSGNYSNFAIRY